MFQIIFPDDFKLNMKACSHSDVICDLESELEIDERTDFCWFENKDSS